MTLLRKSATAFAVLVTTVNCGRPQSSSRGVVDAGADGGGCLAAVATVTSGQNPVSIAIGDLNADGKPDLVVANEFSADVSVLLGHGNGEFDPQVRFAVGSLPLAVAIGDLDADGRPDLAVVNTSSTDNSVSVLLGHGDGTFEPQFAYLVDSSPAALGIRDLNGDGRADVVTANGAGDVSVLLGKGDGTFRDQTAFPVGSPLSSLSIADLNGDGKPDLVVSGQALGVLLNNGIAFRLQATYASSSDADSVAVGDLNGDGKLDLVAANYQEGNVTVLLGVGDGTFRPGVTYPSGETPTSVAVDDLNGDGKEDVVVANRATGVNSVSELFGNGDGTLQPPVAYPVGDSPLAVAVGDLNGDGRPDVAVTNLGTNNVSILLGTWCPQRSGVGPTDAGAGAEAGTANLVDASWAGCPPSDLACVGPTAVVSGGLHSCALLSSGGVECAGGNGSGQLGNGSKSASPACPTPPCSATPAPVSNVNNAVSLSAGSGHTCALLANGSVTCWGFNGSGQLGNGSTVDSVVPAEVRGMPVATGIAAGYGHTCALLADGSVTCWGANDSGQLGAGTMANSSSPVPVSNLSGVRAIAAGGSVTCAITRDGSTWCWGSNSHGQLADGTGANSSLVPVLVPSLNGVASISIGEVASCAVRSDATVECWGDNGNGELGNGMATNTAVTSPGTVPGLTAVTSVSTGIASVCALSSGGAIWCWGGGQLGNGKMMGSMSPVAVTNVTGATSLSTGGDQQGTWCALFYNVVRCWGYNAVGQLGDGTTTDSLTPVPTQW